MFLRRRKKIFCIGRNKTGTTSLKSALKGLGFRIGDQAAAEKLIEDWARHDFGRIIRYCSSADAFQDIPFSLPHTFAALDQSFPDCKFILTIRNSADEWFDSLLAFHSAVFADGHLPRAEHLKRATYRELGWMWRAHQLIYGCEENSAYDKLTYTQHYEKHNSAVLDYFRHREEDLLVLNVSDPDAMRRLCTFLDVRWTGACMPHLNRSSARLERLHNPQ